VDPAWHQIENRSVVQGRPFNALDELRGGNVCLIDSKLQEKLQLDRECVGQSIMIGPRAFAIIGLLEPRAETGIFGGEGRGLEVYVPFDAGWKMTETLTVVLASCRSPELSEDARAELRFFLRRARRIPLGEPDNFGIEVVEEYLRRFNEIASVITLVAGGIVGISLLVGGVGIMNIMLVSVSERTREIGLRKAVGARSSVILLQFLVEAVVLCLMGGVLGVLGGEVLTRILASIPEAKLDKAYIPLWAVGVAFGFAATVGVVFGMIPAVKAARLDPIQALRHE
jgi:putative ABC transport system permease protein